jgi:hypothetical protein
MNRHKWSVLDVCERCSLERKNIMDVRGKHIPHYKVNKIWTKNRPICVPKIPKQNEQKNIPKLQKNKPNENTL